MIKDKIQKILRKHVAKLYPYHDEDIAKLGEKEKTEFISEQADRRDGYFKACMDILDPKMLWDIFQIGKEVKEELMGELTTTEYFGEKMLEKYIVKLCMQKESVADIISTEDMK